MLRSKHWRHANFGGRPLYITTQDHYAKILSGSDDFNLKLITNYAVQSIEANIEEALQINFEARCLETLDNLYGLWIERGELPLIPYRAIDINQQSVFSYKSDIIEDGFTYGCLPIEAPMVYSWLFESGYLTDMNPSGQSPALVLSPKAIMTVEKLRSGRDNRLRKGFFVRRFDVETDAFYAPIVERVREKTGCIIRAVWEDQKNDKLDELILRRIKESSVIIVDVTGERFNVGLELGYAMALRKQIILISEETTSQVPLPFDIRTLNCYFYNRNQPEQLTERITERVLDALEEARLGSAPPTI